MRPGDEGKSMTLMEFISDEPRDAEAYVEYMIESERRHLAEWEAAPNDRDPERPTARECVLTHQQHFIFTLEDILMKLRRERAEQET